MGDDVNPAPRLSLPLPDHREWDPAVPCPECGLESARRVGSMLFCTSLKCDPWQLTYKALAKHFDERAKLARVKAPHNGGR